MPRPAVILLVEDDFNVREVVRAYLSDQGYQIVEAGDGDAALALLESGEPIDLLLTDIVMPGSRDGLALSREARRFRPALKVLHITGFEDVVTKHGSEITREELLTKPFRQSVLLDRIGKLMGRWAVDRNATLRRAYDYWLEKLAGRRLPDRRDLDPLELKEILPFLSIVEIVSSAEATRHRYRLVGTRVCEAFGYDPTNQIVEELADSGHADLMRQLLGDVARTGQPLYAASSFRARTTELSTEYILLPFTRGGDAIQQIVIVQTFDWIRRQKTIHDLTQEHAERYDSIEHPPAGADEPTDPPIAR